MWPFLRKSGTPSENSNISPGEVKEKLDNADPPVLLDVRTRDEYHGPDGYIPGALLRPSGEMSLWIQEIAAIQDREIIVYCYSGARSHRVVKSLASRNIAARNMTGGILAWRRMKFPLVKNG